MSSSAGRSPNTRDLVLCHGCQKEWWQDEHGLVCPACHSDFVEIIDPHDDPRADEIPVPRLEDRSVPAPHPHPMHDHNPWQHDSRDQDEDNIDRVAFSTPGFQFERVTIRDGQRNRQRERSSNANDDTFNSIFQTLGSLLQNANQNLDRGPSPMRTAVFVNGRPVAPQNPFPIEPPPQRMRLGPQRFSDRQVRNVWNTEDRIYPQDLPNHRQDPPMAPSQQIMSQFFAHMQGMPNHPNARNGNHNGGNGSMGGEHSPLNIFAQLFGGVHGDTVYSQEAFDRIMGQMMEANNASSAPGPASDVAINSLPKKKVDKTMMGSDGKAECSVCMDNVDIDDEISVLPCNHWFHGECVTHWLREHDTCPHCRKGITPAEGAPDAVRSPTQAPRHSQNPFDHLPPGFPRSPTTSATGGPGAPFTQPGMQHPYVPGGYPSYPEPQSYVQPPSHPVPEQRRSPGSSGPPQMSPRSQGPSSPSTPRRPLSRRSSASSRSHGEGGRNTSGGSGNGNSSGGVTGWFRSLRSPGGGRN